MTSDLKITAIRVSKLVTTTGYNNHKIEAEAVVEEGQDPYHIHDLLTDWVDDRLRIAERDRRLHSDYHHLMESVSSLEKQRDSLRKEVRELEAEKTDDLPF